MSFGCGGLAYRACLGAHLALGLIPDDILLRQAISLLVAYSSSQFHLFVHTSSRLDGCAVGSRACLRAARVEERAWHSYGSDCPRQRLNVPNDHASFRGVLGGLILYSSVFDVFLGSRCS